VWEVLPVAVHEKFAGAVTVSVNVAVLVAAGVLVAACIVIVELPTVVLPVVLNVVVTVTGLPTVGLIVLEGKNTHAAPTGSPKQLNTTDKPNEPEALT
jgi:hypothetical protein